MNLIQVLIERDGMSKAEANHEIERAKEAVICGGNPEEILLDWFGLEPDYLFDLI